MIVSILYNGEETPKETRVRMTSLYPGEDNILILYFDLEEYTPPVYIPLWKIRSITTRME